jgi:ribonuclease BN (tRNA processing enzyme)
MTGLRVRFVGTGNAFHADGRGAQAIWFEMDDLCFVVDLGPTAMAALERMQLSPERLEACFITHLHGDHIAGWPFLLLHFAYLSRRTRPFLLCGPDGTAERLEALADLCYKGSLGSAERSYPLLTSDLPVAPATGLATLPGVSLDTIPMDHDVTSIGYRFHLAGRIIGVSGDTRWCSGLEDLARGCDLLILECTTLQPSPAAHIALSEVRERVERLDCKRILLTHLDDRVAGKLEAEPVAKVSAAYDGLTLEV